MNRSSLISIAIVVLCLLTVGVFVTVHGQALHTNQVVSAAAPADAAVSITIDNFNFMPPTVTVAAGTKLTWTNHDDVPHTVVSTEQKFKSKVLDTDDSFSYTFTDPGTYPYFCSLHPKMVAKVIVTANK